MQTKFVILAVVVAVAIGAILHFRGTEPVPAEETQAVAPVTAAPKPAEAPPVQAKPAVAPAQSPIAAAKPQQPKLTPEQQAALEAQQEEQDLRDATELIHSTEVDKRVEGAEQLGGFQNPQAEGELVQALSRDPDATVREAAAQSLASFSPASPDTWKALVAAIEDRHADVQASAESSLEALLLEYDEIPASLGWVQKAVKKLSTSKKVSADTREALKGLVEQWEDAAGTP
jgi:HEAT repeat protein